MSIKEKFDAFVKENGTPPRYAQVSVKFTEDKSYTYHGYYVSMVIDEETELYDSWIFYYCSSLEDLIAVTKDTGCLDFVIIEDSVEFTNYLN